MKKQSSDKVLVIVESPNKIKTLTKIFKDLGHDNFHVEASVGHIMEIRNGGTYWNTGIDIKDNFKADFAISKDKKGTVQDLKDKVKLASKIYIASDDDREGEAIAWSLKHFLKIPESKYERITFHEITKSAVKDALENPRKIDDALVSAATTRSRLDKLLGYRLSPVARKSLSAKSVGRCQSAGLKLITDLEKEIINFKPETYYELILNFKKNNTEFKAKYIGTDTKKVDRIKDKQEAEDVVKQCNSGPYIITNVENKEKQSNPKAPFTTSTFQQEVSSKLHISIDAAMTRAQKLFEGIDIGGEHVGLITYIRTDDSSISPEFAVILEKFVKDTYGDKYFAPVKKGKKNDNSQNGHECLRVTDLTMTPEKLASYVEDEGLLKVYDIIYKRTIASSMTPAIFSETVYTIHNNQHKFSFLSKELKFDGYKKVYGAFDEDKEEVIKETFVKDEQLQNTKLDNNEKQTLPPKRYSEASFVKELESSGIGRPSTFATIVKTILSDTRGYCKKDKGALVPTELGMKLSEFLNKSFPDLINIDYTSEMEKSLDLIAQGKLNDVEFLQSFLDKMEASVSKLGPIVKQSTSQVTDKICPLCGANLVKRFSKKTGKYFLGCSNYPNCKHIENI